MSKLSLIWSKFYVPNKYRINLQSFPTLGPDTKFSLFRVWCTGLWFIQSLVYRTLVYLEFGVQDFGLFRD